MACGVALSCSLVEDDYDKGNTFSELTFVKLL
jgi:hypothetical protein